MSDANVMNVSTASFDADVLQKSMEVPVVLEFSASWCEPGKQLSPILEKLARHDAGQWILGKVDVDQESQITTEFAVESIPAVFGVVKGQTFPLLEGAAPEPHMRQILDGMLKFAREQGLELPQPISPPEPTSMDTTKKTGTTGYGAVRTKQETDMEPEPKKEQARLGYQATKTHR